MLRIVNKLPFLLRVAKAAPARELRFCDTPTTEDPLPPSLERSVAGAFAGTRKTAVHNETTDDV